MKKFHFVSIFFVGLILACQGGDSSSPGLSPYGGPAMDNEKEVAPNDQSVFKSTCGDRIQNSKFDDRVVQGSVFRTSDSAVQIDGDVTISKSVWTVNSMNEKFIRGVMKVSDSTLINPTEISVPFLCIKKKAKTSYSSDGVSCKYGTYHTYDLARNPQAGTSQCNVQQEYQVIVAPSPSPIPTSSPDPSASPLPSASPNPSPTATVTITSTAPGNFGTPFGSEPSNRVIHRYSGNYHLPGGRVVRAYKTVTTWTGKMNCNDDDPTPGTTQEVTIETVDVPESRGEPTFVNSCSPQTVYNSVTAKDASGRAKAQTIKQYDFN